MIISFAKQQIYWIYWKNPRFSASLSRSPARFEWAVVFTRTFYTVLLIIYRWSFTVLWYFWECWSSNSYKTVVRWFRIVSFSRTCSTVKIWSMVQQASTTNVYCIRQTTNGTIWDGTPPVSQTGTSRFCCNHAIKVRRDHISTIVGILHEKNAVFTECFEFRIKKDAGTLILKSWINWLFE